VETYNRHTSFGVKVNRSVTRFPIDVGLDCVAHLEFDLTHDEEENGLGWWGWFPSPDVLNIGYLGGSAKKLCHLVDCHSPKNEKCASTTKSITSSVAEQSNCSQNQSTARSAGAMVSNRKSCRSCRVWGSVRRVVLFMLL